MTKAEAVKMWHQAYLEHGSAVFAFLIKQLQNKADAEDILQETFVRAMNSSEKLRDIGKIRSYLFAIARNLMINHKRDKKYLSVSDYNEIYSHGIENHAESDNRSPERSIELKEFEKAIYDSMEKMQTDLKNAFNYAVLQQKSYKEIAVLTGWSLSKVKICVFRARKTIIDEIGKDWFDNEPGVKS